MGRSQQRSSWRSQVRRRRRRHSRRGTCAQRRTPSRKLVPASEQGGARPAKAARPPPPSCATTRPTRSASRPSITTIAKAANAMARQSDYRSYERYSFPVLGGAAHRELARRAGQRAPRLLRGRAPVCDRRARTALHHRRDEQHALPLRVCRHGRRSRRDRRPGRQLLEARLPDPALRNARNRRLAPQRRAGRPPSASASVRGSYSGRSGQGTANVGVIGVALFNERGTNPTWSQEEINRRHQGRSVPRPVCGSAEQLGIS